MKPLPHSRPAARVREAFRRQPLLLAFSFDHQLEIAEIQVDTWPGCRWGNEVYGEIGEEICALVADLENAQAVELLRGRTFARWLQ
jgi:hypothetical protein